MDSIRVQFKIAVPEDLRGYDSITLESNLPFRPHIMDVVVPDNLLNNVEHELDDLIVAYMEAKEFLVVDISIIKDVNNFFYLECYCEPVNSDLDSMDNGFDFLMGEN